jgi:hypothetical protein
VYSLGDQVLFVLSARGELTWSEFRAVFDRLAAPRVMSLLDERAPDARLGLAALLDELGHCDSHRSDYGSSLLVARPLLARLPAPGLPRAVLCGSRSPETVTQIPPGSRGDR